MPIPEDRTAALIHPPTRRLVNLIGLICGRVAGARIRCHSCHGANDWVTLHPRYGVFRHPMSAPDAAARSSGAGVITEVTGQAASTRMTTGW